MAHESKTPEKKSKGNEKAISLAPLDFDAVIDGLLKTAPPEKAQPEKPRAAQKAKPTARRKTR